MLGVDRKHRVVSRGLDAWKDAMALPSMLDAPRPATLCSDADCVASANDRVTVGRDWEVRYVLHRIHEERGQPVISLRRADL